MFQRLLSSRLRCCALLLLLSLYLLQSLGALSRSHCVSPHLPFGLQLSQERPPRLFCAGLMLTLSLCLYLLWLLRMADCVDEPRARRVAW